MSLRNVTNKNRLEKALADAVEAANWLLPEERRLNTSPETLLMGNDSRLDSLGLVNLIVAVEQKIEEEFGVSVVLLNEESMSQKPSPFRTLGSLANHALQLLNRHAVNR